MSVINTTIRLLKSIIPGVSNPDPKGATGVRQAVDELQEATKTTFDVELGEPTPEKGKDGDFFGNPKVVVPIEGAPHEANQKLVFDLPAGPDDAAEFNKLLDAMGLDLSSMEELKGETAPVQILGGNAVVDWREILDGSGSEDSPHTKENVEEKVEKTNNDSKKSTSDAEQSGSDDSSEEATDDTPSEQSGSGGVKVQEKKVKPENKDSAASSDENTKGANGGDNGDA